MQDAKTLEANKQVVRRYKVGILNSRDVDALDEIVAADYLDHAAFPGQAPGLEGLKQRVKILFEALDPRWTIHDMVAERDIVVIRWSHTGTHRGEFLGVPATGKEFTAFWPASWPSTGMLSMRSDSCSRWVELRAQALGPGAVAAGRHTLGVSRG